MSTAAKLRAAMWRKPLDWRIEQLQTVARKLGIEVRSEGGSHHVLSHPLVAAVVSVPAHRPIKPVDIRQFEDLCTQVEESAS